MEKASVMASVLVQKDAVGKHEKCIDSDKITGPWADLQSAKVVLIQSVQVPMPSGDEHFAETIQEM